MSTLRHDPSQAEPQPWWLSYILIFNYIPLQYDICINCMLITTYVRRVAQTMRLYRLGACGLAWPRHHYLLNNKIKHHERHGIMPHRSYGGGGCQWVVISLLCNGSIVSKAKKQMKFNTNVPKLYMCQWHSCHVTR
jgi:hypothetical protein